VPTTALSLIFKPAGISQPCFDAEKCQDDILGGRALQSHLAKPSGKTIRARPARNLPLSPFELRTHWHPDPDSLFVGGNDPEETAMTKSHVYKMMPSPVGQLKLVASDTGLAAILWENDDPKRVRLNIMGEDPRHPILVETERQLREYFAGKRQRFSVKMEFAGTAFQRRVWQALLAIPFGETRSYGDIARELGNPGAVRAVGAANGRNPISIIAPCHRVIGATGKLTGFAGGLEAKARLLALEGALA
jgi:methylated-DNA-[protein]-cysteine S-methyltransferase